MTKQILLAIPHFCSADSAQKKAAVGQLGYGSVAGSVSQRVRAFQNCLDHLTRHFERPRCELDNSSGLIGAGLLQQASPWEIKIVICVHDSDHVLDQLRLPSCVEVVVASVPPQELGFACHLEMQRRQSKHDFFCFLEDDIAIADPLFFDKQVWFHHVFGDESILQPNRFELFRSWQKVYVDGPLPERHVQRYTDISDRPTLKADCLGRTIEFFRPSNPMSACFVLNQKQMRLWAESPNFNDRDSSYGSAMESAQILGPMKHFRVYKPMQQHAEFLEVEHCDARLTDAPTPRSLLTQYAEGWGRPGS